MNINIKLTRFFLFDHFWLYHCYGSCCEQVSHYMTTVSVSPNKLPGYIQSYLGCYDKLGDHQDVVLQPVGEADTAECSLRRPSHRGTRPPTWPIWSRVPYLRPYCPAVRLSTLVSWGNVQYSVQYITVLHMLLPIPEAG